MIHSVPRFKFVSSFLLLLLTTAVFSPDLLAQRRNRGARIQIGDVIQFSDVLHDNAYGLVINIGRHSMEVEVFDERGEIETANVASTPAFTWELIHRIEKVITLATRTWKSEDEKFEIKAKMIRVEDDKVRLEKDDGKSIAVPIKSLCKKDQTYIKKNRDAKTTSSNPFDVEESEQYPEDVVILMERRRDLMGRTSRHQRLAKLYPELALGDILLFRARHGQPPAYGIVTKLGFHKSIEAFDENGELKQDSSLNPTFRSWTFFDRQFLAIPMNVRKWSSANGKFKIQATLVEVEGEKVVLEKEDGKKLNIDVSKLSDTDQKHVKRVRSMLNVRNDAELIEERKEYDDELLALLQRRAELLKDVSMNYAVAKEAARMKSIRLRSGGITFSESTQAARFGDEPISINFPLTVAEHARIGKVFYAEEGGFIAVSASSPFEGKPTLALVNIETQEVVTNLDSDDVGHEGEVIAVSPSGRTLLVSSKVIFDRQVELWRRDGDTLRKLGTFAFDTFFAPMAHLASDESGVIRGSNGDLTFFDITNRIKPTHFLPGNWFNVADKSFQLLGKGDEQVVFVPAKGRAGIHAINIAAKSCVGGIKFKSGSGDSVFAFANVNPDGKSVTHVAQSKMNVYDLETGRIIVSKKIDGGPVGNAGGKNAFRYLGDNLVLQDSRSIYDLELGLEIASVKNGYEFDATYLANGSRIVAELDNGWGGRGRGGAVGSFGDAITGARNGASREGRVSAINSMRNEGAYSVRRVDVRVERLPIDRIRRFGSKIDASDVVHFKAGESVDIFVNIDGDRSIADDLLAFAEDDLIDKEIEIRRDSDFVLEYNYSIGKSQQRNYRVFGDGPPRKRRESLVPKTCSVVLKYKGERIWGRSKSASLNGIATEEQLDENLRRSKQLSANTLYDFELPTEVRTLLPSRRGEFSWE